MKTRERKPKMRFDLIPDDFTAYGYFRKDEDVYTAIIVNLSLFAEGRTPQEALDRLKGAFEAYIEFVLVKHPDQVEKYLNRPVEQEYIDEFSAILENFKRSVGQQPSHSGRPHNANFFNFPYRTLAPQISAAHA